MTPRRAAIDLGYVSGDDFDHGVGPERMVGQNPEEA